MCVLVSDRISVFLGVSSFDANIVAN